MYTLRTTPRQLHKLRLRVEEVDRGARAKDDTGQAAGKITIAEKALSFDWLSVSFLCRRDGLVYGPTLSVDVAPHALLTGCIGVTA